jgi:hypothetical protein
MGVVAVAVAVAVMEMVGEVGMVAVGVVAR